MREACLLTLSSAGPFAGKRLAVEPWRLLMSNVRSRFCAGGPGGPVDGRDT